MKPMIIPVSLDEEVLFNSPSRVFLFAEARSGSNWLIETLASSTEIFMLKEIMQPAQRKAFTARFPEYFDKTEGDIPYIEKQLSVDERRLKGCKILFPQALRFMDLYEFIFNYRNAKFLLLTREDSLKGEVSGLVAGEFGRWHLYEKTPAQQIMIDPQFLYQRVVWRRLSTAFCMDLIREHCPNFMELTYESLFSDVPGTMESICRFLSIEPSSLTYAREVKANPDSLNAVLLNYEEIMDYFRSRNAEVIRSD